MIGIISILLLILAEAFLHSFIIEKKKKDPKKSELVIFFRTMLYLIAAIAATGPVYSYIDAWPVLVWGAYVVTSRWSIFDYALNTFRGIFGERKPLTYLGDITVDDRIEKKINGTVLAVLKIGLLVATTVAILLIF